MNRRLFIASIPFLPSAVKAALRKQEPQLVAGAYIGDSRGIHALLEECGRCVEPAPLDLDEVFKKIYALKRHRNERPQGIMFYPYGYQTENA